jgi:F420-non-reducing hydrogenase iron-sulfur subunit
LLERGTATVPVEQCQACGLCSTECPAKAITMTLQTEDEMLREVSHAVRRAKVDGEPAIVGFACRYCAYNGQEPTVVKTRFPKNVRTIDVLCTGKVDSLYLLKAFELGADGVFVAGCLESECHNTKGSTHAGQRVKYIKAMLDEVGVGGDRLQMLNLASADCAGLPQQVTGLVDKVRELGPSPVRRA